jgi:hypothetical protein
LDSCRGMQIEGLDDDYKSLEILSLINVGLTTLKGFPKLNNLKKLELSDNRINGGLENLLSCPNLTHLNLSGNKLKELDALAPLAKLQHLKNVDLFNCEVTKIEDYREKIFKMLPSLKFLDGFDADDQEEDEFEENGSDDEDEEENGVGEGEEDEEGEEDGDDDEGDEEDDEDDDDGGSDEEDDDVDEGDAVVHTGLVNGGGGVVKGRENVKDVDEEDEDDDDDDDDEEEDENDVGLSYLQKSVSLTNK